MPKMGEGHLPLLRIPDGAGRYAKLPVLTTAQRNALTAEEGMLIFNSTTDQLEEYDGTTWEAVGQVILTTHEEDYGLHTKVIRKTTTETVNNSAVLQDDDELVLPVGANEVWPFRLFLIVNTGAVPDFKFGFTMPAGGDVIAAASVRDPANTSVNTGYSVSQGSAAITMRGIGAAFSYLICEGVAINGATAGNMVLQWAQNTADPSNTHVLLNSYLIATKLA